MDQELKQELDVLKTNLFQIQAKFLNAWTGQTYKKLLNAKKQQADESVKQGHENVRELESHIKSDHDKRTKLCEDLSEKSKMISSLEKELSILNLQTEQLSKKKVLREKQLGEGKKYNEQEEQVVKKAKEKTVLKMNQYTKGIEFFQEHLGFTFKKVDDDHLQFVFKFIDPTDHDALFMFTVKVDDNGTYNIKECSPMIDQLSALTDELNKTNDLSKFVISVRRAFKELVTKV